MIERYGVTFAEGATDAQVEPCIITSRLSTRYRQHSCQKITQTAIDRFNKKWIPEPYSGCWIWIGSRQSPQGYGCVRIDGHTLLAHRVSYEYFVGKIPRLLVIDHLCKTKSCVNPKHMEVVTFRENVLRGNNPPAVQARQTHCKNGHPLSGYNLLLWKNGRHRVCKLCNRARGRRYREKKWPWKY